MAKSNLGAPVGTACAVVMLAMTAAAATDAAKPPQPVTLSGCVVRDAANGGAATVKANGISYKLTGKAGDAFSQYLGKRVEVTGVPDAAPAARATAGTTSASGTSRAAGDQTAVGGQSDVPATGTPRDNTVPDATVPDAPSTSASRDSVPLAMDKGTTADLARKLQVKSIRTVAGSCL